MIIEHSKLISTGSYSLDILMGGYQEGSIIEIGGEVQTGKSLLALAAIAKQSIEGRWSLYIDLERRLDRIIVERSNSIKNLVVSHPNPKDISKVIGNLANHCKVIVIDSSHIAPSLPEQLREIKYELALSGSVLIIISQIRRAKGREYTSGGADLRTWTDDRILLHDRGSIKREYHTLGRAVHFSVAKCRRTYRYSTTGYYILRHRWWWELEKAQDLFYSGKAIRSGNWYLYNNQNFNGLISLAGYLGTIEKSANGKEFNNNILKRSKEKPFINI